MDTPQADIAPASLDDVRAELNQLKKDLEIQKELAELRQEMTLKLSYFKWVGWTFGILVVVLGTVLGFLGIKAWNDLKGTAQKFYEKQLGDMSERYANLSRAFSLVDSGRPREAIPYLMRLYDIDHYDEPVLRVLMHAFNEAQECQEGLRRLKEIRQNEGRFLRLKDPIIFNAAGALLINCSSDNEAALEDARTLLDDTLKRLIANDPDRRFPLFNLSMYYFLKGDSKRAESYLENAASIQADYPSLDDLNKDPVLERLLRRHDPRAEKLRSLWNRVLKPKQKP